MRWLKGPIALGTLRTTGVMGLRLLTQAGTLLLVARLLGPEDFGAFAGLAALAVTLGAFSTFGMHLVLLGEVARNREKRNDVLAKALPVTLSLGGLMCVIFLVLCSTVFARLGVPFSVLLAIGFTETLIQPLLTLSVWELTAAGQPARSQLLASFPFTLRLTLAAVITWITPHDPLMVYGYAYLCASLVAIAVVSPSTLSPWQPPSRWRWPSRSQWHDAAGYAMLNATAKGPTELDKTLATRLLLAPEAGLYAAAQRTVAAITLPISAMMLSALPRLYRDGRRHSTRTKHFMTLIFAISTAYGIALAGILWGTASLVEWLFGASYAGMGGTIRWLCLAVPGMAVRVTMGNILMATGSPWMRVSMELVGLTVLILGSLAWYLPWGITGMALALTCSQWAMVLTGSILLLRRPTQIDPITLRL